MGRPITAAALVVTLALMGCGPSMGVPSIPPGNPADNVRINGLTDCTALKAEFNKAVLDLNEADEGTPEAAAAIGVLYAAHGRMVQLDCEGVIP